MTRNHLVAHRVFWRYWQVRRYFVSAAKPVGGITDLGTLGGDHSEASGINDDQSVVRVVGIERHCSRDDAYHAFYWTPSGPMVDLGTLPGHNVSWANGVNNHGQVAGVSRLAGNEQAVLWTMDALDTWAIRILSDRFREPDARQRGASATEPEATRPQSRFRASRIQGCAGSFSHAVMWTTAGAGWVPQDLGTLAADDSGFAYDVRRSRRGRRRELERTERRQRIPLDSGHWNGQAGGPDGRRLHVCPGHQQQRRRGRGQHWTRPGISVQCAGCPVGTGRSRISARLAAAAAAEGSASTVRQTSSVSRMSANRPAEESTRSWLSPPRPA